MESANSRARTTQNLPDAVVVHALSFLNHVDLCAAAKTARRWRQAVDTRALWTALLEKRCPALLRAMGTCGEPRQLFTRMARKVTTWLPETPLSDVVLYLETRYHGETTLSVACPLDELVEFDGLCYRLRPSPADQTGPLDVVEERRRTDFKEMTVTLIRKSDGAMIRSEVLPVFEDSWQAFLSPRRPGYSFMRQYLADYGELDSETPELVIRVRAMNLPVNTDSDSSDDDDYYFERACDDRFERGDFMIEFCAEMCGRFNRPPAGAAVIRDGGGGPVRVMQDYVHAGVRSDHHMSTHWTAARCITPRLLASLDWETYN